MKKAHVFWCLSILLLMLTGTSIFAFSCYESRQIIQKPIIFDSARIQLTKDYILAHYGIKAETIKIVPKLIVLHWTAKSTLRASFNTFNLPTLAGRQDLPGELNVSAHFLVDRDGTIYQLMPDNWMARHVIGLNSHSIGIENVGGVDDKADLTNQQAESNAYLVCYLRKKYSTIQYLIGHKDYLDFRRTALWLELDPNYQTKKVDPGDDFVTFVRRLLNSHN
jgi:N-acetyl-anhydromuramyl-L-alanine amidase AmpD